MSTYARIESGVVAELITTPSHPSALFNPGLHWIDVNATDVATGWIATTNATSGDTIFVAPPQPIADTPLVPCLSQLEAELAALTSRFALLAASNKTGV